MHITKYTHPHPKIWHKPEVSKHSGTWRFVPKTNAGLSVLQTKNTRTLDNGVMEGGSNKHPKPCTPLVLQEWSKKENICNSCFCLKPTFVCIGLTFFLASCTTINYVQLPKTLRIEDAFPYILGLSSLLALQSQLSHSSCTARRRSFTLSVPQFYHL